MPKLGETVTEGVVDNWLKQVGDTVAFDDPLFEVSTDKVDSEIPSPYDGVILEILVRSGETVPVGTPLVRIGEPGSAPGPGCRRPRLAAAGGRAREAATRDRRRRGAGGRGSPAAARPVRCTTSRCPSSARPSPRARSAAGSSRPATPSRSTTRCSRCPPTRSTRRSQPVRRRPAGDPRRRRGRPCRSARRLARIGEPGAARPRLGSTERRPPATVGARRPRRPLPAVTPLRPRPTAAAVARRSRRSCGGSAAENNLDLATVPGTGVGGRIRREDVEKAIARGGTVAAPLRPPRLRPPRRPRSHAPRPRRPRRLRQPRAGGDPRDQVAAALPHAPGARRRAQGLADARGQRVDLHRDRLRQRRQGAGQAQGPVQEGDRLVAVVPAASSRGRWSTRCGRSRRSTPRSTSRPRP